MYFKTWEKEYKETEGKKSDLIISVILETCGPNFFEEKLILNETEPVEFELRLGWIKKFVNAHSSELLKIVFPL